MDDKGRLVGIVTYPEIRDALTQLDDLKAIIAADVMRPNPPIARPGETLLEAAARMRHHHVDRLPVLAADGSRRIVGILTEHDLVGTLAQGQAGTSCAAPDSAPTEPRATEASRA